MSKKHAWADLPVPRIFPQTYLHVARQRGADPCAVLAEASIDPAYLDSPYDLTVREMNQLSLAVLQAVGDDGLGLEIGWNLPPTAYGNFGYALLCSETMADVLELTRRYWQLVGRGTELAIREQGDFLVGELALQWPFPGPVEQLVYEVSFTTLYRGFTLLSGISPRDVEVWFSFPEPPHGNKTRALFGDVKFDMPVCQITAPRKLLEVRLGMFNPTGLEQALEQCERENALLDSQSGRIVARVRELLVFGAKGVPGLEAVSRSLNITARTLRRRLADEGTSFKILSDEAKRRTALQLLDDDNLDVQRAAELLGYQDPANFTRAFKQWTGQTPSQYRALRKSV